MDLLHKLTNSWRHLLLIGCCLLHSGLCQVQRFTTDGEPQDVSAIEGSTVRMRCRITNVQGPVQWTKDGIVMGYNREIPSFPRYSMIGSEQLGEYDLLISNVQLMDDGKYECQAGQTLTARGLRSRPATLDVLIPPVQPIVEGGPVVEVVAGEATNLTCHAYNGKPAADISWLTGGEELETSYYFAEKKDASKLLDATGMLTITPKKSDQGQQYECRANSKALFNPRTTRISLQVLFAPEVAVSVKPNRDVREFDNVKFTCSAVANPQEVIYQWYRGENLIEGATSSVLYLSSITRDYHNQDIICEAKNSVGSSKLSYRLNILYGPKFTKDAAHVAVDPGEEAALHCHVDANPSPSIIWTKKEDARILSSTKTLKVPEVAPSDFGTYTCQASVIGFGAVAMDVHLLQKGPPSILSEPEQYARFGDVGVLICDTRSIPKPNFTWMREGEVLDFAQMERYSMREEDHAFGRRSIVEIRSVQDEDFVKYNCTVDNGYGNDEIVIDFTRKDIIPLAYILAGALAAGLLLIIVGIILYFYCKRKHSSSDSNSEGSDANLKKKSLDGPDIRVEYKSDIYGNPIDSWRHDFDQRFYGHPVEYDELKYPTDQRANNNYGGSRDFPDSYNYGYDPRDARSDYGTYPGVAGSVYGTYPRRMDPFIRHPHMQGPPSVYSDTYGTYRPVPPRPKYAASDYGTLPANLNLQPARPASRLSTNV